MHSIQGGILSGDAADETKDVLLLDVASLSLGIEVRDKDTPFPSPPPPDFSSFYSFLRTNTELCSM